MERFVLYLDIMGFKERIARTPTEDLKKNLLEFKTKNRKLRPLLQGPKNTLIDMAQFSDSILLVSQGNTYSDLNRISKAAVILMQTALETGFALRGAIAKGEMIFDSDNQIFFGKALVDAYLLEEELSYYGVVFHESAEDCIMTFLSKQNEKYLPIEDIDVPFKKGVSKHYHIEWHRLDSSLRKGDITSIATTWLKSLRKTVSGNPRVYLDNTLKVITRHLPKSID